MSGKKLTGQDRSREQHHPTFHRVPSFFCCAQRRRVGRRMRPTRFDFRMGQLVSEMLSDPPRSSPITTSPRFGSPGRASSIRRQLPEAAMSDAWRRQ
jgi:hypothetical protein